MEPQEALKILYSATRRLATIAEDHDTLRAAYEIVAKELRRQTEREDIVTSSNEEVT